MDWKITFVAITLLYSADAFSKYGRTCKDIGCLNSEVCVLAEDPCSFGHTSNCGTYPTCKKKSQVEGSHSQPSEPAAPRPTPPKPQTPTHDFDSVPNYKPPEPPTNGGGSPYGGSYNGGGSPYGGSSNGGGSPYGGSSNGGGSPYGGSSNGGGSPYGGSSNGGGSPYGGSYNGGGSPYGGSSNGGGSPYGGSSPYDNRGGSNPYGGGSPYNNNPYGGGSNPYSSSSGGNKSPLDTIFNTLNKYAGGGGGSTGGSGSSGSNGLGNIFGNLLGNLSSGGLNNLFNTRPIVENPNYSSYSSNSRSSNTQNYPSGYQANQPTNQKSYGQTTAQRNRATTRKPVSYGWNVSLTLVLMFVIHRIHGIMDYN